MTFADHYSAHADRYARHRPRYPEALFAYLASVPARRDRALDVGTGNGQAAGGLAAFFATVVATDPSAEQIREGRRVSGVHFAVARAEDRILRERTVDLVTAAQAAHWFDLPRFYDAVREMAAPGGAVALWCYGLVRVSAAVDPVIERFARDTVGSHWPPGRRAVDEGYRTLPFPFAERTPPAFVMEERWTFEDCTGYLDTWSAVQRFRRARGRDPLVQVKPALERAWGDLRTPRVVTWPLHLRVGRVA